MAEVTTRVPVETEPKTAPAMREEPWAPLESLRREVDRLFDDFRVGSWRLPFGRPSALEMAWPRGEAFRIAPAMDMAEKDDAYEIAAELPGMDETTVEVKVSNGMLTIRGEKREEKEERKKEYHLSERRFGSFQRSFQIPAAVDADKIDTTFAKGVLTVRLPKTEEAKRSEKKIAVKAG
jgi:HSP20 family protein